MLIMYWIMHGNSFGLTLPNYLLFMNFLNASKQAVQSSLISYQVARASLLIQRTRKFLWNMDRLRTTFIRTFLVRRWSWNNLILPLSISNPGSKYCKLSLSYSSDHNIYKLRTIRRRDYQSYPYQYVSACLHQPRCHRAIQHYSSNFIFPSSNRYNESHERRPWE